MHTHLIFLYKIAEEFISSIPPQKNLKVQMLLEIKSSKT